MKGRSAVRAQVEAAAVEGIGDIFEKMLKIRPALCRHVPIDSRALISAVVALASQRIKINVVVHIPRPLAEQVTLRLLGSSCPQDGLSEADVHDAVGEIANMVAGRVKHQLAPSAAGLAIALPSVFAGGSLHLAGGRGAEDFEYCLRIEDGTFWLAGVVRESAGGLDVPAA